MYSLRIFKSTIDKLTVKNYLSREDCKNWELFSSKLQSLLGRDADSYREEYEQHRGSKVQACRKGSNPNSSLSN